MAHYRLYTLDAQTDHIRNAEDLDAADDAAAIQQAGERENATDLEMWSGTRKVSRFKAKPVSTVMAAMNLCS